MKCSTRTPGVQRLPREYGKLITCRLRVKGITHADVGVVAGVTGEMVSMVLNGSRGSIRVYNALVSVLGFSNFCELLEDAKKIAT